MTEKQKNKIAEVFQRNVDNKLSVELCNGMLQVIFALMDEFSEKEKEE